MQSRDEVLLNLGVLLQHVPGTPSEVAAEGEFYPAEELLTQYGLALAGPLMYDLVVSTAGGDDDYIVQGSVTGTAIAECRRCLDPVETDVQVPLVFAMEYHPSDKPLFLEEPAEHDDEEYLVFGSPTVDFAELLTELFALEQPLTALCSKSCLGLNEDGVNLNHHPELVDDHEAALEREIKDSSPFAALKDILD